MAAMTFGDIWIHFNGIIEAICNKQKCVIMSITDENSEVVDERDIDDLLILILTPMKLRMKQGDKALPWPEHSTFAKKRLDIQPLTRIVFEKRLIKIFGSDMIVYLEQQMPIFFKKYGYKPTIEPTVEQKVTKVNVNEQTLGNAGETDFVKNCMKVLQKRDEQLDKKDQLIEQLLKRVEKRSRSPQRSRSPKSHESADKEAFRLNSNGMRPCIWPFKKRLDFENDKGGEKCIKGTAKRNFCRIHTKQNGINNSAWYNKLNK